ncbi:methyltransferase domain-containing protein [Nocardia uniformis]|uniref:Methyltransferase domain-containing protein n=1 Tax=Nocardia uniformis TaxID=53432 RepID=A0A849CID7_9NOCA|nr:class I SAM-dependent methyltransferase [Nocardia uniformis]NNH76039.1 methyltransferase domain-containing protein [Nocardia uniformis]
MEIPDWVSGFFDDGFEETFRRLGKYDTTDQDIDDLLRLVHIPPGARILDVPCGWGRHAGVLDALGYSVVGVDVSEHQVRRARELWPQISFHETDMRTPPEGPFDAVINLWTSFGSLPTRSEDLCALGAWRKVLRAGGPLIMELTTVENAKATNRIVTASSGRKSVVINGVREDATFDWVRGLSVNTYTRGDWSRTCVTRLYTRSELHDMLQSAGFRDITTYGGFDGAPITDDRRTVLVAR